MNRLLFNYHRADDRVYKYGFDNKKKYFHTLKFRHILYWVLNTHIKGIFLK